MRIAMWSGPRNLSTALMYSFAARSDFSVVDEPFYAAHLQKTGEDHPLADEIKQCHETNLDKIAESCVGPIPDNKLNLYMKHMPHHMVDGFPLDWAHSCVNVHLIRHPARVIASYDEKYANVTQQGIGFGAQLELFEKLGGVVIDSFDIRKSPETALRTLCDAIELPFDLQMLTWAKGPKPYDGVWAKHWYNAVHASTGFAAPEGELPQVLESHSSVYTGAKSAYEAMKAHAIKIT